MLAVLAAAAQPAAASDAAPHELIVRFEPGAGTADRLDARRDAGVAFGQALPVSGLQVVEVPDGASAATAESRLDRDRRVAYAEPNLERRATRVPNDPSFSLEWGLQSIDAPEAWDVTTGGPAATVAVIDTGIDSAHPDLAPNLWTNPGESGPIASNGIDDDGDGLVDDAHGWDWVAGDATPADQNGHGTHVAGTIDARGDDGTGVAGVSWNAGLMPLRVLDASGSGNLANVISAYGYAAGHGAAVVNASYGGTEFSRAEYDTIRSAPGTLIVAAAGNTGADEAAAPEYPCAYDLPNVICVAATDERDALASFSNFGAAAVDLGAPGVQILSDRAGGGSVYMSGTSMATPHVAGTAALLFAHRPNASVAEVKQAILSGADPVPALAGRTVSGARLDARGALDRLDGLPPRGPASGPSRPAASPRSTSLRVSLRVLRHRSLRWVARHGLRVRVGCPMSCRLAIRAVVSGRTAQALRARARRSTVTVARRHVRLARSGKKTLRLRLARRAVRALRRTGHVRLAVIAAGRVGHSHAGRTRSVRLTTHR